MRFLVLLGAALLSEHDGCHAFAPPSIATPHGAARRLLVQSLSMAPDDQDIVIIGGGISGLSAAHYLATKKENVKVTLLERETLEKQRSESTSGSFAGPGMLGIQTYGLEESEDLMLLDLFSKSKDMYDKWVAEVEDGTKTTNRAKTSVGYRPKQGLLVPSEALGDNPGSKSELFLGAQSTRSTRSAREMDPYANPEVANWADFAEMDCIDPRRLTSGLRVACSNAGVIMNFGEEWSVKSLRMSGKVCEGVNLQNGDDIKCDSVIVANGALVSKLLEDSDLSEDLMAPTNARSLVLQEPDGKPMKRAYINGEVFVAPTTDGRVIVGTNAENDNVDRDDITLSDASQLVAGLDKWDLKETLDTKRPRTKDFMPILGKTNQCENVYITGGYGAYGLMVAPKAGQLIGDLVVNEITDEDQKLLDEFSPDRKPPIKKARGSCPLVKRLGIRCLP